MRHIITSVLATLTAVVSTSTPVQSNVLYPPDMSKDRVCVFVMDSYLIRLRGDRAMAGQYVDEAAVYCNLTEDDRRVLWAEDVMTISNSPRGNWASDWVPLFHNEFGSVCSQGVGRPCPGYSSIYLPR